MKVFGSWGRYYDWVKYELARGSFGGDTWLVYYRSLDTLDVNSLSLANMPGRTCGAASRDRRVPNFDTIDPDLKPMFQDATNLGLEYQLTPTTALSVQLRAQQAHPRDRRRRLARCNGNEVYFAANPGEGMATTMFVDRPDRAVRHAEAAAAVRRARPDASAAASRTTGSAAPTYTISRLYGNYAGLANSDEITTPTTGVVSATAQQQAGSIARPGTAAGRAWDLDELEWDSHGNLDVRRPPRHRSSGRREALRLLHAAVRHADRRRSSTPAAARR